MDNLKNQIKYKQIRTSSSQINIKPKSKTEDLVILINNLNLDIKSFYQIIKKYLKEARQNINNNSLFPQQVFDLIEQCLNDFINKAKDTFKKMKYTHKINVIQQEINNNILNNNKIKLNSEDIYLNYNYNNDKRDKYFNEKKLLLDDEYLSSLCNNTSTSIKINNYFDNNNINNLNNINQYNNQYYPNKIQKINKITKSSNKFPQQILSQIYKKNSSNPNLFSDQKVKCYEYNGLKERKNNKSVSNLRKKKYINRNSYSNKSLGKISYYNNTDATSQNNFYSSKKEILNNLNNIISSLNEIKLIKGNIFNKSWEAEEYQKLLNVIINQLDKLIKNIFDEKKNLYKKSPTISLFNENEDNSVNISGNSLIKKKEESLNNNSLINNNGGYNLTYNYKIFDKNDEDTLNNIKNLSKNKKIYYDMEIRTRDLIISQLKNELNMKIKTVHNQNIRYNQLKSRISKNNKFKSVSNSNSKEKKPVIKNDNLNASRISKMNVEIMENKKIIIDLKEKIKNYEKLLKNYNLEKHLELITQKNNELKKSNETNEKLKNQINLLNNKLEINNKQRKPFQKLYIININSFSIVSYGDKNDKNSISEEAKKIINEMKNELQIKNESNEKLINEINIYKNEESKLKEEISKLNIEITNSKNNEIKLKKDISDYKENISKCQRENEALKEQKNEENKNMQKTIEIQNQNIEKYKKLIAYQEEEIKSLKNNTDMNIIIKDDLNKEINDIIGSGGNSNNIIKDNDKKNKQKNSINQLQIEQDKIVLKYELLKNDYEKLNSSLQQKQKLLDNYSLLTNETNSKKNIDDQILELVSQHKKEIENLTKKYNQNIINLKMNLPISYSPNTHCILIDKSYSKYNLRWFLLTIITADEKDYENTFWVSEQEIKPMLDQFNNFRTEKELEQEHFESIYVTQQKWIKQIDENERLISKLKAQLQKYENSSSG